MNRPPSATLATILERIKTLRAEGRRFVLCLVTHTEGSTYRKSGALAVVSQEEVYGVISGGCLEPDLIRQARSVLLERTACHFMLDTVPDSDLVFGSGSGCRGRTYVLAVPDHAAYAVIVNALLAADQQCVALDLALLLDGDAVASGACWYGSTEVSVAGGLETVETYRDAPPRVYALSEKHASVRVARLRIPSVPRLLIIGAGPEAAPLIRLSSLLGWRETLVDHRSAAVQNLEGIANRRVIAWPADALSDLKRERFDACVIMTHTAAADLEALRAIGTSQIPYVGLLGPPERRNELMRSLNETQRQSLAGRLRSPVGLKLGGHCPESLALSIAAQLQMHFSTGSRPTDS